jgi:predicted SnoaL-like aldol condensation-catalyzing enzyme
MSAQENKIVSWRLQEEVFGQDKLALVDELLAPDYVSHAPGDPELSRGPEDIKEIVRAYHAAFPDLTFTVEKQVAEGDLVVTRWIARGTHQGEFMGVSPSGRRIEVSGMSMDRISGSRIVEHWNNWEALEMMEQIGAIPESEHTQGI